MTSPAESHNRQFNHVNGTQDDLLDRMAVAELCKGWPVYRDASEWMNFRSLFCKEAYVWTTWSGARTVDEFIQISKSGKETGAFIMHRECGTLVELNRVTDRALGKMKATITQRFKTKDGVEYDVDCDCQFLFFCTRLPGDGQERNWKAKYVKLIYMKDKVVPVDGHRTPVFDKATLGQFPDGYKYLGAAQASLGYKIDVKLATAMDRESWKRMYDCMEKWLSGLDAELFW